MDLVIKDLTSLIKLPSTHSTATVTSLRGFITLATILLSKEKEAMDIAEWEKSRNSILNTKYEYIVAGGGTAGCVLANRLAKAGKSVLLIEAGFEPLETNYIPIVAMHNVNHPQTEWMHYSIPQRHSGLANPDKRLRLAAGKSLGGSSNLNWMIYMRGNLLDYNNWASMANDSSYTYDNLLPYFKKIEDYHGNFPSLFHGMSGPVWINRESFPEPLLREWMTAGEELGIQMSDPNGHQKTSFFPVDVNIKKGRRFGVYLAYLEPALGLSNLKILKRALVDKILFNDDKEATGVSFWKDGVLYKVHATEEVIVSGGALGTPQILQRSGIGDTDLLRKLDVEVISDLPGVGKHLQDHVNTFLGPFLLNDSVSFNLDRDLNPKAALFQYANDGNGLFGWNLMSGMGFINTTNHSNDYPNVQIYQTPLGVYSHLAEDATHLVGLSEDYLNKYFGKYVGMDASVTLLSLVRPKSTGTVRIVSTDPHHPPLIDPNYYSDEEGLDLKAMVESLEFVIKIYEETHAWKRFDAHLIPNPLPRCEDFEIKSTEYLKCYAKHITSTTWHYSGTAKMGNSTDPLAVLDSKLRVRGVKGLRVVDASVFPDIPNGNTHIPTIMIAEKAADMILQD